MKKIIEKYDTKVHRALEILPGVFSWTLLTMPVWLSLFAPTLVAYFVIFFIVYWFYRSAELAINSIRSYIILSAHTRLNWNEELKRLENTEIKPEDVHHVVVIPTYKEPIGVLEKSIDCIKNQTFGTKQISVIMGFEERDEHAKQVAQQLQATYKDVFENFWVNFHPLTPGEVVGKSSNMAHVAKNVKNYADELGWDISKVTISSSDSDSRLPEQYFSYLTHKFISDPKRTLHFYQGALLFYNNIWRVPLPVRVVNTIGSIWNLSRLMRPGKLINVSTYTLSLKLCHDIGYWDVDVIPEDWHIFFKAFFAKGVDVQVEPIFLPILSDAAESTTYMKTMHNQYEQMKRWAWGVTDTPYIIKGWFMHPEIPFLPRTIRVLRAVENHFLWPVNWFIITLGATLPAIINPAFRDTVLGQNLPVVAGNILTVSMVFLLVVIIIDWKLKPPRPGEFPKFKIPLLLLQWISMPIIGFVFGALPGLDAHTRLMFGKYMEYRVTEKVDK